MAIPALNSNGELPPGEHIATLTEVENRFGQPSPRRKTLMKGLLLAVENFRQAGVKTIWLDGSFTTDKEEPSDIDGCWEYNSLVDMNILDPVFCNKSRVPMKAKYGLDFFLSHWTEGSSNKPFPEFFQVNRDGESKGIILVNLRK